MLDVVARVLLDSGKEGFVSRIDEVVVEEAVDEDKKRIMVKEAISEQVQMTNVEGSASKEDETMAKEVNGASSKRGRQLRRNMSEPEREPTQHVSVDSEGVDQAKAKIQDDLLAEGALGDTRQSEQLELAQGVTNNVKAKIRLSKLEEEVIDMVKANIQDLQPVLVKEAAENIKSTSQEMQLEKRVIDNVKAKIQDMQLEKGGIDTV